MSVRVHALNATAFEESYDHHEHQADWDGLYEGDLKFNDIPHGQSQAHNTTRRLVQDVKYWNDWLQGDYFWIRVKIDDNYSANEYATIVDSLRSLQWSSKVIKFQLLNWKTSKSHIVIQKSNGCSSHFGQQSDANKGQVLNIDTPCIKQKSIQHLVLHTLGFAHEHSRSDRDNYIAINYDNIRSGYGQEFAIINNIDTLGIPYDFSSAMQYGPYTFSKGTNLKTIVPKSSNKHINTSLNKASWYDIIQMRLMYQCTDGPRQFSDYNKYRCTSNCKCWKNAGGCKGDSSSCKGNLICNNNVCE